MTDVESIRSEKAPLWLGAALTTFAAVLLPRVNAVLHENQAIYQLDRDAAIFLPVIVVATLLLFTLLGSWAWRRGGARNRPARVGLVCGTLAVVGFVAFFLNVPIILGGLAITLGLEGMRRAPSEGKRGQSQAAIILGTIAALACAALWLFTG